MSFNELEEGETLSLEFEKRGGLIPAIAQDARNGQVLMLGYANREAVEETVRSRMATFYSTSRNALWKKGETSGDYLKTMEIYVDCDQDAIIYLVEPQGGGACHTKSQRTGQARHSCFYRRLNMDTGRLEIIE
ncbi:MAG: phosphoribosyl-AMP cyclohydrolase [Nitrospinae bacterium]|nr:phosphoribosyl-AMP cyclohydrolase [Nitrospinota bacterium]